MNFDIKELNADNINDFAEFLPEELVENFAGEGFFGWGILVDDAPAGAGVFAWNEDEIELLWIYIAQEERGAGLAEELLSFARFEGEMNDIRSMSCTYLVPAHEELTGFLSHMGFTVHMSDDVPEEYKDNDGREYIYIALWGEKYEDAELPEDKLIRTVPGMGYILPRFHQLAAFFDDNEYEGTIVYQEDELPYIELEGRGEGARFFISPQTDGEPEDFVIMANASRKMPEGQKKENREAFEAWQAHHEVTSGHYDETEGVAEYVAALAAEGEMPGKAMLVSFVETFLNDINVV